ncbi:MAG: redoxin domain-containing protein [Myxococcales bacterium]|nr:redoxin domain-containing protein [Myxococcales bacterium]
MNNTLRTAFRIGLTGLALIALAQCSTSKSANERAAKSGGEEGCYQDGPNCLPPIDFIDENGTVWTPELLKGKVVVINFWATWCKPCQHEIPDLARVHRKYKEKGVVMLGLLMTDNIDKAKLKAFSTKYGLDYPVVRVGKDISRAFGGHPLNLPTNFVYGRTGHLMFDSPGAITAGALEREIKELL